MSDTKELPERRKQNIELQGIKNRLDAGDKRMKAMEESIATNTELTEQIARNTAGLIAFSDDLASGSRFLCRCVKAVQFVLKEVIDPYWKPALICFIAVSWAMNGFVLPKWVVEILKELLG